MNSQKIKSEHLFLPGHSAKHSLQVSWNRQHRHYSMDENSDTLKGQETCPKTQSIHDKAGSEPRSWTFFVLFLNFYNAVLVSAVQKHKSAMSIYIFSLLSLPLTPSSDPCRLSQSTRLSYRAASHYLFYTWWCVHVNGTISIHLTLSFPHCVHKIVFYIFVSRNALQIGSSAPFFQIPYICISI